MANKQRNSGRVRVIPFHDPDERYGSGNSPETAHPPHELDSPESKKLWDKLREWLRQEQEWQADNREQQAIDCDYYDSLQTWTEEDYQVLEERGQAPLVFNKIKPVVDWIIGTERRTRVDWKILPRRSSEQKDAEIKTALFKYVADQTKAVFLRSRAFNHSVKAGVGWIEAGIRGDATDDPLYVRRESWRNVWYDHNSTEPDLSDARYLFRQRWVDLDIAEAMFPERVSLLRSVATARELSSIEDDYDLSNLASQYQRRDSQGRLIGPTRTTFIGGDPRGQRKQVRLFEAWFRVPEKQQHIRGGKYRNTRYDDADNDMVDAVKTGTASTYDALVMQMHMAIFCDKGLLHKQPSPYRHNRFSLIPVWAYRRDRDNAPYGIIRATRDPQDDLNKRSSKALFLLSANRVIADEDVATPERWEEIREEVARPDAVVLLNGTKNGRFEIDNSHQELAKGHVELAGVDAKLIEEISGINSENMGRETNAQSGKAILARQAEGSVITTELFDNYRLAYQLTGEIMLSLIEQYYDEEKTFRITGEQGRHEWFDINKPEWSPVNGWTIQNDITASQADFVVSEQDYRESLRIAMFESMIDLTGKLPPEVALNLLDLVVEFSDVPGKDEIVRRIRKINGQTDPSKDDNDPEAIAARQAEEARIKKQIELEEANLDEIKAKVDKLRAEAKRINAESVKAGTEAAYSGMQTAQVIATVPGVAPIADEVLRSAGYQPPQPAGVDPNLPQPAQQYLPFGQQAPQLQGQQLRTSGVGERAGIETQRNDGVRQ